ncbi:MAG: helix-turn-helix transcriptional regulator [Planctomycetota bacterium]
MAKYQDIYPTEPLLRSQDAARPLAADLLNLEYFEAEPGAMPTRVFDQHHVLLNLNDEPHRVENWRGGEHRDFTFCKNEVVVTPAGLESGWRWHIRSKVIVLTIDPDKLERFCQSELGLLLSRQQLLDRPQFEDQDLVDAAVNALDALRDRGPGSEVMYECLARVLLVKLVRKFGEERAEAVEFSPSFTAEHYRSVLDLIEAKYAAPLAVEDLARAASLSPSHFARLFKETVGESPHQFLTRYRVERASAMLADPTRALIDVALACGFSDQPHFSRVFKKVTGSTPRQYRQTLDQDRAKNP